MCLTSGWLSLSIKWVNNTSPEVIVKVRQVYVKRLQKAHCVPDTILTISYCCGYIYAASDRQITLEWLAQVSFFNLSHKHSSGLACDPHLTKTWFSLPAAPPVSTQFSLPIQGGNPSQGCPHSGQREGGKRRKPHILPWRTFASCAYHFCLHPIVCSLKGDFRNITF